MGVRPIGDGVGLGRDGVRIGVGVWALVQDVLDSYAVHSHTCGRSQQGVVTKQSKRRI